MANSVVRELPGFELPVFLSTATAGRKDRRLALVVVLISLLIFVAAAPFARLPLPQMWAFIPIYESVLPISDLITAVLLFAQFPILRSRALLVLACGYLFTALMAVAHMLTFPGLFSPTGLLGAGPQSTAWLYMFWHGVFPITVIAYALTKGDARATGLPRASARLAFLVSIVSVVAAVVALTSFATIGHALLPSIMRGNGYTPAMIFVVSTVWMLSVVAVLVLWVRRPHTVLDLWLMVVMCAWIFDLALSAVLNTGRFDLGFYVGRIYGLLAATFVLLVLLLETGALYAQLARLLATEQRERKREVEARHRIFEASLDLILVVDRQGNFLQASPNSGSILGYLPEEMIGRSASKFVYPDDIESMREEMRTTRRGRQMRAFETRYLHKDGRAVALAWTGVWSEPGQQYLFVGRDMTERHFAEEKFRLAVEASPSGIVMIDANGAIVLINAETERMFGYGRQELVGQPVDILVPAGMRGHHVQHRTHFTAHPETRRMGKGRDLYGLRKDGTQFPVEIGLNPIQTQHGLLVMSAIVDITESKKAQQALTQEIGERRRIAEVLNNTITSMVDPVLVADETGKVLIVNPAAQKLFGRLPGVETDEYRRVYDRFCPDGVTPFPFGQTALFRAVRGESVDNLEFIIRPAGSTSGVHLIANSRPLRDADGALKGAVAVYHDITERKKAEEALLESERTARGIIDTALDAFLQMSESGIIIDWSPKAETMFGWSRQEAVGQKLGDLIVPPANRVAQSERLARFMQHADSAPYGRRFESASLRRDGKVIDTEISLTAFRRREGYVFNGFIRDVTEKKAAEEQLHQAQKMESVGQLTGGIAHDFNNMLTVITGTIDILAEAVADKPQLAAIAKLISEATNRGAELTGHLLAFARKQPLQPRNVDINVLMVESTKLLRPTLGEPVEIEASLAESVWSALVDPAQLSSAILNLAVNARDAMPNGGKLTLETANVVLDETFAKLNGDVPPGNYVMIAVSDTGAGIPAAIRDKVFEPFFSTKDVGKGTGLGLSMVYGFVKQSGGHINVYSEEGQGTTFRIYLPQSDMQSEYVAEATPVSLIEGGDEAILVVEDDAMVRTSVTAQLQSLGYRTLSATNAVEAITIINSGTTFDLLFTDVIMPGLMNGRQLADEVAKRRPGTKVLFTSGYTENTIIHHGRLDPDVLLLAKPYRKADLARMLRMALDGRPVRQQSEGIPRLKANY
jgi:PAS domain S-box-containing protein